MGKKLKKEAPVYSDVVFNEVTHCLFFVLPVAKTKRSIDDRIFTFSLLGVEIIRIKKW